MDSIGKKRVGSNEGLTDSEGREAAQEALWQFVPLAGYRVPGLPASNAMANAWASFKRIFLGSRKDSADPFKAESELRAISLERLGHLVPAPDWRQPAKALDGALGDWLAASGAVRPVRFVVGQPFCGLGETLGLWGSSHDAVSVAPPSFEDILAGGGRWFESLGGGDGLWVLPSLEHCILRHARGLGLVRRFLDLAQSGRLGRGVIGCDSWAWAYLRHVWPVDQADALTLQAFDGPALAGLLTGMTPTRPGLTIRFRNASTGSEILATSPGDHPVHPEVVILAARCRGNVGAALRCWRERLRTEPEGDGPMEEAEAADVDRDRKSEQSVWVAAASPDPVLPSEDGEEAALVLHAALVHGGLPESLLHELLPMSPSRCRSLALRLRDAGFLRSGGEGGRWTVRPLAYAAVRGLLRGRDYLVDDF